ncbi:hypothetical protein TNCV_3033551 [Trichonephila clavipes]|nr:hypothetical protein TNCV_3033551 [Trichonephila clavipes]
MITRYQTVYSFVTYLDRMMVCGADCWCRRVLVRAPEKGWIFINAYYLCGIGTLNTRRAESLLNRLVNEEERWVATLDHSLGLSPLKLEWKGIEAPAWCSKMRLTIDVN